MVTLFHNVSHYITSLLFLLCISLNTQHYANASNFALLIGISNYPQFEVPNASWDSIHGSNDIELLSPTLKKRGFYIKKLTEENATASNIRKAFADLLTQITNGDLVYIHFSGHGQPYEDNSGDETDGWDEAFIPFDAQHCYHKDYMGRNHILDDELELFVNELRLKTDTSGYVYVVLDACHAGGASRGENTSKYIRGTNKGFSPNNKKFAPTIDRRGHLSIKSTPNMSGICYVEACRSYQTNTEIKENNKYYGPLTFYINESLKVNDFSKNNNWLSSVIFSMTKDRRLISQNPVIETDK